MTSNPPAYPLTTAASLSILLYLLAEIEKGRLWGRSGGGGPVTTDGSSFAPQSDDCLDLLELNLIKDPGADLRQTGDVGNRRWVALECRVR